MAKKPSTPKSNYSSKTRTKKIGQQSGKKKSRSRSKEDKEIQMQRIIDGSLELIRDHGFNGFGMRALASHIGMSQGNLYNYIDSMRELWIEVRRRVMLEFRDGMKKVAYSDNNSSLMEIFEKISLYVLDFAREDMNRWKLIMVIPAPAPPLRPVKDENDIKILDSEGKEIRKPYIGPIEKAYKSLNVMDIVHHILERAQIQGEIMEKEDKTLKNIGLYLYSVVLGVTFVEHELNLSGDINEPLIETPDQFDLLGFRRLMFSQMKHLIGDDSKE